MPRNITLTQEEERALEEGGGVKEDTKKTRERCYEDYRLFAEKELGKSIPDQFQENPEVLSQNFNSYFWTMVVAVKV